MRAFGVLGLVFSIPSQDTGLVKRLRSDLFCVERDTRPVPPRVRRGCWRIPCGKRRTLCGHRIAVRPSRSRTPCRRRQGRPLCRAVAAGVQTYRRTFLHIHTAYSQRYSLGGSGDAAWWRSRTIRYDTIRDAILTCARKPT